MDFAVPLTPFAPSPEAPKAPMSAARLAAEAAFADPGIALERRPAAAVVIEVRPRRSITAPAADDHPANPQHHQHPDGSQLPPGDRPSRVFRMQPALRQAMGLPDVDDGAVRAGGSSAVAPRATPRRRKVAPLVHVVQAAEVACAEPLPMQEQPPTTGRWATMADALARLEATFSAIRAAQAFNTFADLHLPASAATMPAADRGQFPS